MNPSELPEGVTVNNTKAPPMRKRLVGWEEFLRGIPPDPSIGYEKDMTLSESKNLYRIAKRAGVTIRCKTNPNTGLITIWKIK